MKLDAIVLSGRHRRPEHRLGQSTKSMIEYAGFVTLDLVLEQVVRSDLVNSVVVIGPDDARRFVEKWNSDLKPVHWVDNPEGYSMFQNLMHAYRQLLRITVSEQDREVFFTCSDIPFITSEIISDFIAKYAGSQFTAVVPIVTLSSCRKLEQGLGVSIPSVEDHLPIALDGELYHLGNMGLLRPDRISNYWLDALCLSRDAREITSSVRAFVDPKRIRLLWHLLSGFLSQNKAKNIRQFLRFARQLSSWVVSSHYFKLGKEERARESARRVSSQFLFREFFPGFGLYVSLVAYEKPEVFLDFDTMADVDFINGSYGVLKKHLTPGDAERGR